MPLLRWTLLAAAVPVGALCAACSSNGEDTDPPPYATTLEQPATPGPYGVGVTTVEVVDTSRPTQGAGNYAGDDERLMTVEIWYPADPAAEAPEARDARVAASGAPYPLIVFAHGLTSSRRSAVSYTQHLASRGYVVVAPDFPLTRIGAPGGIRLSDLVNQPADVSFVIDQAIAMSGQEGHRLRGAVDPDAIGMTGISYGGYTTLLSLYGPDRDERIDAALPIAPSGCILTEAMVDGVDVPVLFMAASEDLIVPYAETRLAYDLAEAPKYWAKLAGGGHVRFTGFDIDDEVGLAAYRQIQGNSAAEQEATPVALGTGQLSRCAGEPATDGAASITLERQQELLRSFATPFFDAYLRDDASARAFLEDAVPALSAGVAEYEYAVD